MKHRIILLPGIVLLGLILAGCESDRLTRSGVFPSNALPPVDHDMHYGDEAILTLAASRPPAMVDQQARKIFDGRSLEGWKATGFAAAGAVELRNGLMVLRRGEPFTGVNHTNRIPSVNYEASLDAMRVSGEDFFCGLTFPVKDSFCSLIVGGWGGTLVGLSSLDGADASENDTTKFISFENGRWYHIRLRVTEQKIEAWIEQKKVVNVVITGRKVATRFGEIEQSKPFGIATWNTTAALREIRLREVTGPESDD